MRYIYGYFCLFLLLFCVGCEKSSDGPDDNGNPILKINTQEKLVSNTAGSFEIYITSNTLWKVESKNSWLTPEKSEGQGDLSVRIRYAESSSDKRTGIIRFIADGLNPVELTVIQTGLTFTNPIAGIPDPWVVKHEGFYYLCKADGNGINIAKSDKLSEFPHTRRVWNSPTDAGDNKPWNVSNIWAPELHRIDGKWYIYYTAGRPHAETNSYNFQRSGVLRAKTDDPMGEWEDMGMLYTGDNYRPDIVPSTDNTAYGIDLSVFQLNKKMYAVWSGYPEGSSEQNLYIATMSDPLTITSSRSVISSADKPWERHNSRINEGPAFLKNKEQGKFFVVYSCNGSWTKHYRLGYIMLGDTLANPTEPANWTKSANEVFYRNDDTSGANGVNGVGHCSFTKSPDGQEDWIVYHVKNRNDDGWSSGRSTFIQKFGWKSDGTPYFGTPAGWGEPLAIPSGESH